MLSGGSGPAPAAPQTVAVGNAPSRSPLGVDTNTAAIIQKLSMNRLTAPIAQKLLEAALTPQNKIGRYRPTKQGIVDTVTGQILPGTEATPDAEFGTTANTYTDEEGNVHVYQLSKAGGRKDIEFPKGAKPALGVKMNDTGTEFVPTSTRTGQQVGPAIPKDVAGEKTQEAVGKDRGAAQITLPVVEQTTDRLLDRLDRLDKSPIRGRFTGYQGYGMNITPEANDYQAILDEVQGNTFLTAFNNLRGGGAITEAEGAKATASLTRLQQTAPSDAGYQSALDDARAVFKEIRNNVRRRAGQSVAAEPAPQTTPGSAPQPGQVEDGYRFKGGNPADPNSWEQVQ
jgi:hypothetical protein